MTFFFFFFLLSLLSVSVSCQYPACTGVTLCASASQSTTINNAAVCCLSGGTLTSSFNGGVLSGTCSISQSCSACSTYTTCSSCATISPCGWCSTTGTCQSCSSSSCSSSNGVSCSSTNWFWNAGNCPNNFCSGNTCSGHGTCTSGNCVCNSGYTGTYCETATTVPNWIGTWTADTGCSRTQCCCISGTFTTANSGGNLILSGPVAGVCNGITTTTIPFGTIPTTFVSTATIGTDLTTFTLSSDSNTITARNSAACSGAATRNANTCTAGTCNGHGSCNAGVCSCYTGYTGIFCQTTTPNWIGYWTVSPGCSLSQCCCVTGSFTTTSNGGGLSTTFSLAGLCGTQTSTYFSLASIPTTFSTVVSVLGQSLNFVLASDSNSIQVTNNANNACSGSVLRSSPSSSSSSNVAIIAGAAAGGGCLLIGVIIYLLVHFGYICRKRSSSVHSHSTVADVEMEIPKRKKLRK